MFGLIARRLNTRLHDAASSESVTSHPDEDAMNAFVEGQLTAVEYRRLVSHLVTCAACLHLTAQMIRNGPELEQLDDLHISEQQRGPLQRFFDALAGGVASGSSEDAVFAYEEKKPFEENEKDKDSSE